MKSPTLLGYAILFICLSLFTPLHLSPREHHSEEATWKIVPSPQPANTNTMLYDVAASSERDVWAVGSFSDPHPPSGYYVDKTLIEHWNGTIWKVVPSPNSSDSLWSNTLRAVAVNTATDAMAVGNARNPFPDKYAGQDTVLILHWDGQQWANISPPALGGTLLSIAYVPHSHEAWAVGTIGSLLHWDGTTWHTMPGPSASNGETSSNIRCIRVLNAHSMWIQGSRLARWNGTSWRTLLTPPSSDGYGITSFTVLNDQSVWTVGSRRDVKTGDMKSATAFWNGHTWRAIASSNPERVNRLAAVVSLTTSDIWAVGDAQTNGIFHGLVDHWNGKIWSLARVEQPQGANSGLSAIGITPSQRTIWAVGWKQSNQYPGWRTLIERYQVGQ